MRERDGSPPAKLTAADVHIQLQFLIPLINFISDGVYVLQIRLKDSSLIRFADLQQESSGAVFLVVIKPLDSGSKEIVFDYLIRIEADDDITLLFCGEEIGEIGILN